MLTSKLEPLDTSRIAIFVDPGDVHVGVSMWEYQNPHGWTSIQAQEMAVEEFQDFLADSLRSGVVGLVVFETFQLYGDKAMEQTGSEFETSQLIGVVKYLVRTAPIHWPETAGPCQITQQGASIKKATKAILKAKKVKSVAKAMGMDPDGHALDAEMHGYQFFGSRKLPFVFRQSWP